MKPLQVEQICRFHSLSRRLIYPPEQPISTIHNCFALYFIFLETRIIGPHFVSVTGAIFIQFFLVGCEKRLFRKSAFQPFKVIQGHWFWYQSESRRPMRLSVSPS